MDEPRFDVGDRIMFARPSDVNWAANDAVTIGAIGTVVAVDPGDSSYNVRWEPDGEHYWIAWRSAGEVYIPDLTDTVAVSIWLEA